LGLHRSVAAALAHALTLDAHPIAVAAPARGFACAATTFAPFAAARALAVTGLTALFALAAHAARSPAAIVAARPVSALRDARAAGAPVHAQLPARARSTLATAAIVAADLAGTDRGACAAAIDADLSARTTAACSAAAILAALALLAAGLTLTAPARIACGPGGAAPALAAAAVVSTLGLLARGQAGRRGSDRPAAARLRPAARPRIGFVVLCDALDLIAERGPKGVATRAPQSESQHRERACTHLTPRNVRHAHFPSWHRLQLNVATAPNPSGFGLDGGGIGGATAPHGGRFADSSDHSSAS
jgi:hypothetical protein